MQKKKRTTPSKKKPRTVRRRSARTPNARLRDSAEHYRLIVDGIQDYAIFLLEVDGRIASWTPTSKRILGFSAREAIGKPLSLIFPSEDRLNGRMERELHRARDNGSVPEEGWHARKGDQLFWATGNLAALRDGKGKLRGFVKVLRDNTERKSILEALKRAKSEAESANVAKDQFLANASHELRTPLAAMLLWARLLAKPESLSAETFAEGLVTIEKSAKEQQRLIEDLVDSARIVGGKLRLQLIEVELETEGRAAVETIRASAKEKGISLEARFDTRLGLVRADAMRLQQVFSNLLHNAVKFTPAQAKIRVSMDRDGDVVQFQVTDTGIGISPEFLPLIFDRFTQSETSKMREKGLGLGLAIARQLVLLHGGDITATSAGLAKGSTFTVRLPLPVIQASATPRTLLLGTDSLRNHAILLVEDDPETRSALTATLRHAGAEVTAVENAAQAIAQFKVHPPTLVLSDIGLGDVSGHEIIARFRAIEKEEKRRTAPAMALTAYTDQKNRTVALESGFNEVLSKPIDPADLIQAIARLLTAMR